MASGSARVSRTIVVSAAAVRRCQLSLSAIDAVTGVRNVFRARISILYIDYISYIYRKAYQAKSAAHPVRISCRMRPASAHLPHASRTVKLYKAATSQYERTNYIVHVNMYLVPYIRVYTSTSTVIGGH